MTSSEQPDVSSRVLGSPITPSSTRRWLDRPGVIAVVYVLLGWSWILVTDWLVHFKLEWQISPARFQTLKGVAFITGTGVFLWLLLVWRKRRHETAQARLDLVLSQLPGFLWTTDRDLRLLSITGLGLDRLAIPPDDLLGQPVSTLVDEVECRAVIEAGHRKALTGEPEDLEVNIRGRELVVRVEPLRLPAGRIVGCVAFALDVSGLRTADAAHGIRDAVRRSQLLATVGSLVLDVAHKLKNPLFAMTAALDAFEARAGHDPKTARHRSILRQQVERIHVLVNGLQEFGRVGDLDLEPCDLGAVVHRVTKELAAKARKAGVELVADVSSADELGASVDSEAFVDVLRRLVVNAIQHSPAGEAVRISARPAPGRAAHLQVAVDDAGPGFQPQDRERALEPLFSRNPERAGLGLSIAERIVKLHGGRIELGTSPAGGAQVLITLARR